VAQRSGTELFGEPRRRPIQEFANARKSPNHDVEKIDSEQNGWARPPGNEVIHMLQVELKKYCEASRETRRHDFTIIRQVLSNFGQEQWCIAKMGTKTVSHVWGREDISQ